ncbi:hypothetical protein M6D81_15325 [Paenibacillus sp. J5C_2022]|nr:hypothetical protein [Paenibacillus sp. J5C2022]
MKQLKEHLRQTFSLHQGVRQLREESLTASRVVSLFESALTRTLDIAEDQLSEDIIIVQTYFFNILEDLISFGFYHRGEKYICFTASAGQIRTKKTMFMKETVFQRHERSLMCGLTLDGINRNGGVNINKFLAYLALCNTATEQWKDFDIERVVVVDDMETPLRTKVDYIDDQSYDIKRMEMDLSITHTDGCGMILPKLSKKSFMLRMPWVKGLLVPFPFDKYIRELNLRTGMQWGTVRDIYGREVDLLKDKIAIILTRSQFKMWSFYSSWEAYKQAFTSNACQAGICNEEDDNVDDAKLNYQMLQTLTDMTDDELLELSRRSRETIANIGSDRDTMLRILGVSSKRRHKNYYQQALALYPELLNDTYSKQILKQVKKKLVKEARSGKVLIDGKYTYICPDLYAFCEYLIAGKKRPTGLLADGEVSCSLYSHNNRLDCLRSPHLYREHAVRSNVVTKETKRWFITNGLYTSCHDPISKLLMFDHDGDKSLVCADPTLVHAAEQHMADIVPLYYDMAKAEARKLSSDTIYGGLKAAYTGGNIGTISNDITKIWNSASINLDVIKWLCMENNFTIDYAKTLYKLSRPQDKHSVISGYTTTKPPSFFQYAKDVPKEKVAPQNDSVMNRLAGLIQNPRLNFRAANLGQFDYRMLMKDWRVELNQAIIEKYNEVDIGKRYMEIVTPEDGYTGDDVLVYRHIREQFQELFENCDYVADVLVEYLYRYKASSYKTTLWSSFGDLLLGNLEQNLSDRSMTHQRLCEACGCRMEMASNRQKYCNVCRQEKDKIKKREWKQTQRSLVDR